MGRGVKVPSKCGSPNPCHKAARRYASRGWKVLPLHGIDPETGRCTCGDAECSSQGKHPRTRNGLKDASSDPAVIDAWWAKWPDANVGVVTGDNLRVYDMDPRHGGEESHAELEKKYGPIPGLRARTGGGGLHIYMAGDGSTRTGFRPGLDLKGAGGYVVAAPSLHASLRRYEWIDSFEGEIPEAPEWLDKVLGNGKRPASAPPVEGKIPKDKRNCTFASLAGSMRRRGMSAKAIYAALSVVNQEQCDPPLKRTEVRKLARGFKRYDPERGEDPVIGELNEEFAHVMHGGKSGILRFNEDGSWDLLQWADFKRLSANRPRVPVGDNRTVHQADYFLNHPLRRDYPRGVRFQPGGVTIPGTYNSFHGWAFEPSDEGCCDLFLEHVRENICRGDFEWVMGWFAHLFQHPERKLGTALVFRGKQGTGKTIVGRSIGGLLGPHYRLVSSPRYITGNFNAHLAETLLLQGDESFFAGDPSHAGALKDLITSDLLQLEKKYFDPVQVPNYVRLLFTSNAGWVVPAGMEERRFAVFDVGDGWMQKHERFGAMIRQLEEEGGYAALLHFLLNFPVDESLLRGVPKTEALKDQKAHSLSPEEHWWQEILVDGMLPGSAKETENVTLTSDLYRHYLRAIRELGVRHPASKTALGIFLRRVVPGLTKRRDGGASGVSGIRERRYGFPSLRECRLAFDPEWEWLEGNEKDEDWREYVEPM